MIKNWVVARTKEEALQLAYKKYPNENPNNLSLVQDPDVLDTWFSSGLFPFSTMGWPNQDSIDLNKYYPGSLLETGHDILFFWVAKMVMMSLELNNKLPFNTVYLHAMVRDKIGRKMSKSLGNVVDPLDVINGITLDKLHDKLRNGNLDPREVKKAIANQKNEFPNGIAQCGADALRYGLLSYTIQGRDINLNIDLVVNKREFCNKLWNATKFALLYFQDDFIPPKNHLELKEIINQAGNNFRDLYIMSRLSRCIRLVNEHFHHFHFGELCDIVYKFWLNELCSTYLELIKPILQAKNSNIAEKKSIYAVLYTCLLNGLKLIHPIMPYVSEELYHRLPAYNQQKLGDLMNSKFPEYTDFKHYESSTLHQSMDYIYAIVNESRSLRANLSLTKTKVPLYIKSDLDIDLLPLLDDITQLAQTSSTTLLGLGGLDNQGEENQEEEIINGCTSTLVVPKLTTYFYIKGLSEISKEVIKQENSLIKLQKILNSRQQVIENPNFNKLTIEKQQDLQAKLIQTKNEILILQKSILNYKNLMTKKQLQNYYQNKIKNLNNDLIKCNKNLDKVNKNLIKKPKAKKLLKQKIQFADEIQQITQQIEQLKLKIESS